MKTIIGGLLVVSLMSTSAQVRADYDEYEEKPRNAIYVIKCVKHYAEQIYSTLANIEDNTRKITSMLVEKNKAVRGVYSAMEGFAQVRAALNDTQINTFASFVSVSKDHEEALRASLQTIDSRKGLSEVKRELLHKNADFAFVYNELKTIESCQRRALSSLDAILQAAGGCLDEFENVPC
ncbi:MAG: hypothetical protein LBS62_10470 [Clostridiales bacterium]|jgi:hypothetical protein|nr:hypothetical protein [Clostridiales bacterium]